MYNMKRIIIVVVICIILITSILIGLLIYVTKDKEEKSDNPYYIDNEIISGDIYNYQDIQVETLEDKTSFYTVSQCISNYLDIINLENTLYYGTDDNGNYTRVIDDETISKRILDVLDNNYISQNNITTNNIKQFIDINNKRQLFTPLKMNILPGKVNEKYAVYGFTEDLQYNYIKEYYFIVTLDIQNYTYMIQPLDSKSYKNIDEIKLENTSEKINKNENNQYTTVNVDNEYISNKYLDSYKRMLLGNSKLAYECLNEEYKTKKYGSFENFEQYISNQKAKIKTISLAQYSVSIKPDYTQYICIDENKKYYIFQETAPMQYTVILDTYTIDLPEFIAKYDSSSDEEKVLLNIQKFFSAINDQDYKYAYSKLDATFKNNNFKTQAEFESYVKKNFFTQNSLSTGKAEKQGDVYLYNVVISDGTGKTEDTVTKSFVMQLKEGTDFVMSFSVK